MSNQGPLVKDAFDYTGRLWRLVRGRTISGAAVAWLVLPDDHSTEERAAVSTEAPTSCDGLLMFERVHWRTGEPLGGHITVSAADELVRRGDIGGERFYVFDVNDGMCDYLTEQEAREAAERVIENYREDANEDGAWNSGVEQVEYGRCVPIARAERVPCDDPCESDCDACCDFILKPTGSP